MVSVPDVSGAITPLTDLIGSYGEGIFWESVIPALLVSLLMLSAITRLWE